MSEEKTKPTEITPEEARPGDRYIWHNVNKEQKVNQLILAREGDLIQIALTRWLSLFPEMGTVKILRGKGL